MAVPLRETHVHLIYKLTPCIPHHRHRRQVECTLLASLWAFLRRLIKLKFRMTEEKRMKNFFIEHQGSMLTWRTVNYSISQMREMKKYPGCHLFPSRQSNVSLKEFTSSD